VFLEPGEEIEVDVIPAALVVGAGLAGLTVALSLANRGLEVKLVEREPTMGGLLRSKHRLYPTGEDARSWIAAKIEAVTNHPSIEVFTEAEVRAVRGFVGNYEVLVEQGGREFGFSVGAVIVATGAKVFEPVGQYGYDGSKVVTQADFERLLVAQGGELDRGVRSIVMIQCVGSRNEERPYCSRICCMTAVKNALFIKEANPEVGVYVMYRDMLTLGAVYEALYREARGRDVPAIQPGRAANGRRRSGDGVRRVAGAVAHYT
jgi:heterodisulfide reductase subunit A